MEKKIEITIEITIGKKIIKLTHDEAKELYRLLDTTPSIKALPSWYYQPYYYGGAIPQIGGESWGYGTITTNNS